MFREFAQSLMSQIAFVALLFAVIIGPFLLFRFDIAFYVSGAFALVGVLFIYWPRGKKTTENDKD